MTRGDGELTDIPIVVVVGSIRSGTSCVAGVLHNLGVCMGTTFQKPDKTNSKGYYEGMGLKSIARRHLRKVRSNTSSRPVAAAANDLRKWGQRMRMLVRQHPEEWTACGGKYPFLCYFSKEIKEAWSPNLYVIGTSRPVEESLASAKAQRFGNSRKPLADAIAAVETGYTDVPFQEVEYNRLVDDTEKVVREIVDFLPCSFSKSAIAAAVATVDPKLRRHRGRA